MTGSNGTDSAGMSQELAVDVIECPYLSFVVPVYGSPESLEPLCRRVKNVCDFKQACPASAANGLS